jgi:GT2 family glycosyltransferase
VEWIVIDHDSSDDSLELLDHWARHLDLRVVALDRNDSFSASCNLGASLANAPNLLFMNNDIRWCMDALPQMLNSLRANGACAVGLKLIKPSLAHISGHEVQHLGVRFKLREQAYWPYEARETRSGKKSRRPKTASVEPNAAYDGKHACRSRRCLGFFRPPQRRRRRPLRGAVGA